MARTLLPVKGDNPLREGSAMQVLDVLSKIPFAFWGIAAIFIAAAVTIESKSE